MKSHKKSFFSAMITMILCFSFIGTIYYFKQQSMNEEEKPIKEIEDFLLSASDGLFFTKAHLKNKVTVLFYIGPEKASYDSEKKYLDHTASYIDDQLKNQLNQKTLLLAFADFKESDYPSWHLIPRNSSQKEELVKIDPELDQSSGIIFFDKFARPRGKILLSKADNEAQIKQQIEKMLSKLLFDQYLNDYLSKRTFFGPKRDHS